MNGFLATSYTIKPPPGVPTSITVWGVTNNALTAILALAAVGVVITFVYAGISFIMSHSDPGKIKGAQAMMTNAAIGFVIIVAAFFILQLINFAITGQTIGGI